MNDRPSRVKTQDKVEASIFYAEQGFRVCLAHAITADGSCSCKRGAACRTPAKHPFGKAWNARASADPERARRMWEGEPLPPFLTPPAPPSYPRLILDLDRKPGKPDGVAWACRRSGMTEEQLVRSTLAQRSPSNGTHLLYVRRTMVDFQIKT